MSNLLPAAVLGAITVCFLTFISTDFAFIVLIFSMLLSPEFSAGSLAGGRSIAIRAEDLLIIVIFITWMAGKVMQKETGLFRRSRLNGPIAGYIAVVTAVTLLGILTAKVVPLRGAFYLLKYIEYFMLFFMVANSITGEKQVRILIFFMLLTAVCVCVYALTTVSDYGRATAPFEDVAQGGEPNTLGGYLILICGLAFGMWVYSSGIVSGALLLGLLALCGYTLLQTLSRGSYLGFIAVFVALVILATRKKALLAGICIFALISGWTLLPARVIRRVQETFVPHRTYEPLQGVKIRLDESASARVETWKSVFEKWKYSPFFGYGASGAGLIDSQYPLVLGETGIVGMFFFLSMISALLREGFRVFNDTPDGYCRGIALGFLAGLVGLLVHSFSAATFIIIRIMEPFWFLTGIVVMLPELARERAADTTDRLTYAVR